MCVLAHVLITVTKGCRRTGYCWTIAGPVPDARTEPRGSRGTLKIPSNHRNPGKTVGSSEQKDGDIRILILWVTKLNS